MSDEPISVCPDCGGSVRRILGLVGGSFAKAQDSMRPTTEPLFRRHGVGEIARAVEEKFPAVSPPVSKATGPTGMKCTRCGRPLKRDEICSHLGQSLCEDCYMDALSPPRACDPWAVHAAQTYLRGKEKSAAMTELQRGIVGFIKKKGKAQAEEIEKEFGMSFQELQRELATLRHMEILRGLKEEGRVYYTLFEENRETG